MVGSPRPLGFLVTTLEMAVYMNIFYYIYYIFTSSSVFVITVFILVI